MCLISYLYREQLLVHRYSCNQLRLILSASCATLWKHHAPSRSVPELFINSVATFSSMHVLHPSASWKPPVVVSSIDTPLVVPKLKKKHLHKNMPYILHPYLFFTNLDAILSVQESGAPAPRGWKSAPVFPNVHKIKVKGSSWYEYSFVVLQVQGNQFLCQFCRWTGINSFAGQPILIYNTAPKRLVLNY